MKLRQYQTMLRNMQRRMKEPPLRRVMRSLPARMKQDIQEAFATRTSPGGQPWPPRKGNATHPLLVKSGAMKRAALAGAERVRVQRYTLRFDYNGPAYGIYHTKGTRSMPRREFFGVTLDTLRWLGREIGASFDIPRFFINNAEV